MMEALEPCSLTIEKNPLKTMATATTARRMLSRSRIRLGRKITGIARNEACITLPYDRRFSCRLCFWNNNMSQFFLALEWAADNPGGAEAVRGGDPERERLL
jgi:hypothetical protein